MKQYHSLHTYTVI